MDPVPGAPYDDYPYYNPIPIQISEKSTIAMAMYIAKRDRNANVEVCDCWSSWSCEVPVGLCTGCPHQYRMTIACSLVRHAGSAQQLGPGVRERSCAQYTSLRTIEIPMLLLKSPGSGGRVLGGSASESSGGNDYGYYYSGSPRHEANLSQCRSVLRHTNVNTQLL